LEGVKATSELGRIGVIGNVLPENHLVLDAVDVHVSLEDGGLLG